MGQVKYTVVIDNDAIEIKKHRGTGAPSARQIAKAVKDTGRYTITGWHHAFLKLPSGVLIPFVIHTGPKPIATI